MFRASTHCMMSVCHQCVRKRRVVTTILRIHKRLVYLLCHSNVVTYLRQCSIPASVWLDSYLWVDINPGDERSSLVLISPARILQNKIQQHNDISQDFTAFISYILLLCPSISDSASVKHWPALDKCQNESNKETTLRLWNRHGNSTAPETTKHVFNVFLPFKQLVL